MNWLETFLTPALVRALGWTLVHSLWQGAVVALSLAGLLLLLRRHSAQIRYGAAAVALVAMLALGMVTFGRYYYAEQAAQAQPQSLPFRSLPASLSGAQVILASVNANTSAEAALAAPLTEEEASVSMAQSWLEYFDRNLPILVTIWLLGLLAMTLRMLGGLAYVQRLRHYRVRPLSEEWQARLAELASRAGVTQSVSILESALVRVPLVVGHLRPVILLPLGTVTGLSQNYLEAILAHELAHIARRDYLMNLLQSVAEILFFYHPAVWFITATLRNERENCCDDAATALVGGNPMTLARALTALAERCLQPHAAPRLALSAVGTDGSLLGRVRRLVQGRSAPTFTEGFMAACVVLTGIVLLTTAVAMAGPRPAEKTHLLKETLAGVTVYGQDTAKALVKTKADSSAASTLSTDTKVPAIVEREVEEVSEMAVAAQDDEPGKVKFKNKKDKDKARKGKNVEQVVVVEQGGRGRRNAPGTVVIQKDKKGRVTDVIVDGQQVVSSGKAKKGEKIEKRVEVIRVRPNGMVFRNDFDEQSFNRNFNQAFPFGGNAGRRTIVVPGPAERIRIREQARRAAQQGARVQRELRLSGNEGDFEFEFDGPDTDELSRNALEDAERGLRKAEAEATTDEEREHIREALNELREQRADSRERQQEIVERRNEQRDQGREADELRREADRLRREADRLQREADRNSRTANDDSRQLTDELLKDGLISSSRNYTFDLTTKALTVNGKKQSEKMRQKYAKMYAERNGRPLTSTSHWRSEENRTTARNVPRPPQPPRAPQAPRAPRMGSGSNLAPPPPPPGAPAMPPPPPAPPRLNTDKIRAELRKDGLLDANKKGFQLQLTGDELKVNGKTQSAEMARKYRRLLNIPEDGKNSNNTVQISITD
ncbi:M56 family metallopeptidase [Hymenobacter sp. DG25A]|uniref:M56 family metallopeptidase n=1 Tax=Hymenobacter sp. DG25A TaxID=1385663 RepID=UPI0006C8B396|nr:M56 family metallopeptidase [Hymenobacter sp. DG25A]